MCLVGLIANNFLWVVCFLIACLSALNLSLFICVFAFVFVVRFERQRGYQCFQLHLLVVLNMKVQCVNMEEY